MALLRATRFVVGLTALALAVVAPSAAETLAQSPSTTPTTVYPLSESIEVRARGNQALFVHPLKTTRAPDGREAVADRILVGFTSSSPAQIQSTHASARALGAGLASPVRQLGDRTQVVDVSGSGGLAAALSAYRTAPGVRYAEPDYVYRVDAVPNDPQFSLQWGMTQIKAPAAWDVTHGSSSRFIAILDTGIYDDASPRLASDTLPGHPDLRGKVAADVNFSSEAGTDDNEGHGTHVSGIAAAITNNGIGVAGVGYSTRLLNVKVLDATGSGADSAVGSGIRWAADNGASVINLSLGAAVSCTQTDQDAIDYAWSKNVVIVVAAGNDGTSNLQSPASCNHVIAVASTDSNDTKSGFSTFGTWVQVAAPGGADQTGNGILSTSNTGDYVYMQGTSMAAPHVSGLAALVWSTFFGTSNDAVVQRIESTADPIAGTGTSWSSGRVNAAAAVTGPCSPRPPLTVTAVPASAGRLQVTVSATGASDILQQLQFGNSSSNPSSPVNALVDVGSLAGQSGNFSVALPPGTTLTTFYVRRATAGVQTTVPLVVTDSCGSWPTLVGGGPSAF